MQIHGLKSKLTREGQHVVRAGSVVTIYGNSQSARFSDVHTLAVHACGSVREAKALMAEIK